MSIGLNRPLCADWVASIPNGSGLRNASEHDALGATGFRKLDNRSRVRFRVKIGKAAIRPHMAALTYFPSERQRFS